MAMTKTGCGADIEEAFTKAVKAKDRGKGVVKTLERPPRKRADQIAKEFEGKTDGGWHAIPCSYVEARDYKAAHDLKGQRGEVYIFIKR
jgi:hypothetical protein